MFWLLWSVKKISSAYVCHWPCPVVISHLANCRYIVSKVRHVLKIEHLKFSNKKVIHELKHVLKLRDIFTNSSNWKLANFNHVIWSACFDYRGLLTKQISKWGKVHSLLFGFAKLRLICQTQPTSKDQLNSADKKFPKISVTSMGVDVACLKRA